MEAGRHLDVHRGGGGHGRCRHGYLPAGQAETVWLLKKRKNFKKPLAFPEKVWYSNQADLSDSVGYPGVAKFGIAREWGSRGLEFESQHSDQVMIIRTTLSKWVMCSDLSFLLKMCCRKQKGGTSALLFSYIMVALAFFLQHGQ